jgi:hypothetical protein
MPEMTMVYCVNSLGKVVTRGMFLHEDDSGYYAHPLKKVNRLSYYKFHSKDPEVAATAAGLILATNQIITDLEQRLKALEDKV